MLFKLFSSWWRLRLVHIIFNHLRKRKNTGKPQLKTMGLLEYALELGFAFLLSAAKKRKTKTTSFKKTGSK